MGSMDVEDINDEIDEVLEDEESPDETIEGFDDSASVAGLDIEEETQEAAESEQEDELSAAQAVAAKNYEKYLLAVADLANYKKRAEKEKADLQSFANEKLILEVLPVADNLQRALDHAGEEGESNLESLTEGVNMTIEQLFKALAKFGLTEVKSVGEKFNPEYHHAISHDNSTDAAIDTVVSEFQKGFILKGRLIRPAMVSVANDEEE